MYQKYDMIGSVSIESVIDTVSRTYVALSIMAMLFKAWLVIGGGIADRSMDIKSASRNQTNRILTLSPDDILYVDLKHINTSGW